MNWLLLSFAVAIGTLAIATYFDLKYREIPDKVFLIGGGIGGFVVLVRFAPIPFFLFYWLFFSALLIVASYLIWRFGRGLVGGADAKAFMFLGIVLSFYAPFGILAALIVGLALAVAFGIYKKLNVKAVLSLEAPFMPLLLSGVMIEAFWVFGLA